MKMHWPLLITFIQIEQHAISIKKNTAEKLLMDYKLMNKYSQEL